MLGFWRLWSLILVEVLEFVAVMVFDLGDCGGCGLGKVMVVMDFDIVIFVGEVVEFVAVVVLVVEVGDVVEVVGFGCGCCDVWWRGWSWWDCGGLWR